MNLCYSLGIGPGGRLLLPGVMVSASMLALMPSAASVEAAIALRAPRSKRTREESAALKERVCAALQRDEGKATIAAREGVGESYVAYIAEVNGLAAPKRSRSETEALARRAYEMIEAQPDRLRGDIAKELGITHPNMCVILKRYGYR